MKKVLQPALLAGLFIAVVSSLPLVGNLNACCCLWVVAGGVLATYLQQQQQPEPLATSDAILGGLVAGIFGGLLFSAVMWVLDNPADPDNIAQTIDSMQQVFGGNVPPDFEARLTAFATHPLFAAVMAVVWVLTFAVFAMLGSLLGLAIFRKKAPPVAQA